LKRQELEELHYIAPIANVPSVCNHGILSHNRAKRVPHETVAMQVIQDRRAKVIVPGGRPLHDYANLYFHARNPMMYKRSAEHEDLCVIRVATDVLDIPGVVVSDRNASSGYARFWPAPAGLAMLDHDMVFAQSWTHSDTFEYWRRKSAKCCEVLVPDRVHASYLLGAYVSCAASYGALAELLASAQSSLEVTVNAHLFFR